MLRLPRIATNLALALAALASHAAAQSCFDSQVSSNVGAYPDTLVAADLDGDGDQDLVLHLQSNGLNVSMNLGNGVFGAPVHYPAGGSVYGIAVADLTGDGFADIVASVSFSGTNLALLVNQGDGTFAVPVLSPCPAGSLTLADLDGDGDLDAAVVDSNLISILFNQGSGIFGTATTTYVGNSYIFTIVSGDLDQDGDVDLVYGVANYPFNNVGVLLNPGNGVFGTPVLYPVGAPPWSLALGDLDGDGQLDLAVAHAPAGPFLPGSFVVLMNQGGGIFGPMTGYPAGLNPDSIACADLDGDGDLDLAVACWSGHEVRVFLNQGAGGFPTHAAHDVDYGPNCVVCADLDGDGDSDVAATNYVTGSVSVLLNCTAHWTGYCPGDGSAGACPCANSGSAGRGCDNSGSTGGALLAAAGGASLTHDTLVLNASGELDFVSSIVLQGSAAIAPVPFGDGLRCVGGSLKRLYLYDAFGGDVSAPLPGDASISARSAFLGDAITAGATRYYQVYYRDPTLGFCAAPQGNSWNVSSAVSVLWVQ